MMYAGAMTAFFAFSAAGVIAAWAPGWFTGTDPKPGAIAEAICAVVASIGLCLVFGGASQTIGSRARGSNPAARYIFAVGAFMLLNGLAGNVVIAGFVFHGKLAIVSSASGAAEREMHAYYIIIAAAMSFIGALFFVTYTVWRKRYGPVKQREAFDADHFWAGLSLRLGEAIIFNLCFVLLLASLANETSAVTFRWLPILGLVTGMFVKSGEQVVFGIAGRLFDAARAFVPTGASATDPAGSSGDERVGEPTEHGAPRTPPLEPDVSESKARSLAEAREASPHRSGHPVSDDARSTAASSPPA